jgi:hypothetical protein
MEQEFMYGLKIVNIKDNGQIIKCMAKVKYNGLMVKFIKANMIMIKNKVWEHLYGLMEGNIMDNGKTVSNMEEVSIIYQIKVKKLDNGYKENGLNG